MYTCVCQHQCQKTVYVVSLAHSSSVTDDPQTNYNGVVLLGSSRCYYTARAEFVYPCIHRHELIDVTVSVSVTAYYSCSFLLNFHTCLDITLSATGVKLS